MKQIESRLIGRDLRGEYFANDLADIRNNGLRLGKIETRISISNRRKPLFHSTTQYNNNKGEKINSLCFSFCELKIGIEKKKT